VFCLIAGLLPALLVPTVVAQSSTNIAIFQFGAFYNLDLDFSFGQGITLNGKVHANGNLWMCPQGSATFNDTVEATGVVTNHDNPNDQMNFTFNASYLHYNGGSPLSGATPLFLSLVNANINPTNVEAILNLPPPGSGVPDPAAYAVSNQVYLYNTCDLIISNSLTITNGASWYRTNLNIYFSDWNNPAGPLVLITNDLQWVSTNGGSTVTNRCYSFVTNVSFYDFREGKVVQAVQIDVAKLGYWLTNLAVNGGNQYNQETLTDKGHGINSIYIYNGVPLTASNLPAVRLVNGSQLPSPYGLTIATPMPLYVLGNYNIRTNSGGSQSINTTNTAWTWPAALLADAITVLSGNWNDTNSLVRHTNNPSSGSGNRVVTSNVTINAACLAGIVPSKFTTHKQYSGGIENFLRLQEDWSANSIALWYNGSIAAMFPSRYATNYFIGTTDLTGYPIHYYTVPTRKWGFDANFLNPAKLPPLTPFVQNVTNPPVIITQPTDQTVPSGNTVIFGVTVYGYPPLSCQWSFNGTNLNRATNISLTLTNVQFSQAGNYTVLVTNAYGAVLSSNAVLTVIAQPPIFLTQPTNQIVFVNGTATFSVTAAGSWPLSYQWNFNGTNISGATNTSLTLTNVQFSQAGNYAVLVTNLYGFILSSNAMLTVNPPPPCDPALVDWWQGEGNANDIVGNNNGTLAGGAGYAAGEVGQAFSFDGSSGCVSVPDSASLDSFTTSISIELWLKINQLTANSDWKGIVTKGNSSWRLMGTTWANTVYLGLDGVSPSGDLYGTRNVHDGQWHHVAAVYDGTNMFLYVDGTLDVSQPATGLIAQNSSPVCIGATDGAYELSCHCIELGYFFNGLIDEVSIYNRALSSNEIAAIYAAGNAGKCFTPAPPTIPAQPTNQTVTLGGAATFSVTASGTPPLSYQWNFNGTDIDGAANASLMLTNVQMSHAGNYTVQVTNLFGSILSSNAVLTVVALPPTISSQPANQTVIVGGSTIFSATAAGSLPLSYQWQFDGTDVTGDTNSSLALNNVQTNNQGTYQVVVNNPYGSVTSSVATLTVARSLVVAWGNTFPMPADLTNVVAIAAGSYFDLALRRNGTVVAWGNNIVGQTNVPPDLTNVVAIAAGNSHSLALQASETVVAWGYNDDGETQVPGGLANVVAIAAGSFHSLALQANGTVVAWGYNGYGQNDIPADLTNVVSIAEGNYFDLALRANDSVVGWGSDVSGQINVPADLTNVVAVAAGTWHSLALKADGTIVGWGYNSYGQASAPAGLTNVVAIAAGYDFSLALQSDGTVVGWGDGIYGTTKIPAGLTNVVAIAAGDSHSLALENDGSPVILRQPTSQTTLKGAAVLFNAAAVGRSPLNYQWQKDSADLTDSGNVSGTTTAALTLTDVQTNDTGIYTLVVTNDFGSITSSNAVLTVLALPFITTQPAGCTNIAGATANFSVVADGTAPLIYQWQWNGTNLVDATNATLTLNSITMDLAGSYSVSVANLAGSVTSSNAILSVYASAVAMLNGCTFSGCNGFEFQIAGVPGFNYAVQESTNLIDWVSLITNTSPFIFVDTNAASFPQQFYRTLYVP
jgi:hypothetical protein